MKLLGDLLVGGKAISFEQRDRAVAHAKKEKVRLGTALLELGYLSEEMLLRALSVQRQVPPAPAAELKQIRPDILRLVPQKLAARLRVVPFRRVGRQVSLAMRDPNDLPAIDEVAFLTGLPITPHVAPEVRIELSLFRHYEVEIAERFHKVGKRLEGTEAAPVPEPAPVTDMRRTPSGQFAPIVVPAGGLPRPAAPPPPPPPPPPSLSALPFEKSVSGVFPVLHGDPWASGDSYERAKVLEAVDTFEESLGGPESAAPAVAVPPPPPAPPPPAASAAEPAILDDEDVKLLRGEAPIEAAPAVQSEAHTVDQTGEISVAAAAAAAPESFDLVTRLATADSRDEVADAVLQATQELVRRAALFIVQTDRVIGWAARPAPPDGLRSLVLPFSEPSVFATLRNTDGFYLGPCPELPANRRALQALGVLGRASIAVVPITLRGKSVLFLLGEFDSGTPAPPVASLKRLASMTATALEILLLKNRLRQS